MSKSKEIDMNGGLKRLLMRKIEEMTRQGVTFGRLAAQLEKWRKQYGLSASDVRELRNIMGV